MAGSALYQLTPLLTVGKALPAVLLSPELREQHAQKITSTSNYPLRQGKTWCYEGGIKVPLFIYWPGVSSPPTRKPPTANRQPPLPPAPSC